MKKNQEKKLSIFFEFLTVFDTPEYKFEDGGFYSIFGSLKIDTIDNKFFPTSGFLFEGDFKLYVASSDLRSDFNEFSIVKSQISKAFKIADKLSMNIGVEGGFKVGNSDSKALHFGLGGYGVNYFNNYSTFYGYDYFSLNGNSFVKIASTIDYEFINKHHFNFSANFCIWKWFTETQIDSLEENLNEKQGKEHEQHESVY